MYPFVDLFTRRATSLYKMPYYRGYLGFIDNKNEKKKNLDYKVVTGDWSEQLRAPIVVGMERVCKRFLQLI